MGPWDSGEVEHPGVQRGAADGARVLGGAATGGGVDHHLYRTVGQQLRNVRAALPDLVHLLDLGEAGGVE